MFERVKDWLGRRPGLRHKSADWRALEIWAAAHGMLFECGPDSGDFALSGPLQGPRGEQSWRMERSGPSRDFILGAELNAWADLGLPEDAAIMLINRPLKDDLEKRVYEQVTLSVQTSLDADLPEEVRWLSLYDEVGWSTAPLEFWDRYAIVADSRAHAQQWLDGALLSLLMDWPTPAVQQMTPFILQLQQGRLYLRMEYPEPELATLEHAVKVFIQACASARALIRV